MNPREKNHEYIGSAREPTPCSMMVRPKGKGRRRKCRVPASTTCRKHGKYFCFFHRRECYCFEDFQDALEIVKTSALRSLTQRSPLFSLIEREFKKR